MGVYDLANRVNRITRYIRINEGNNDYISIPTVTLSDNYGISLEFMAAGNGVFQMLFGTTTDTETYLGVTASGALELATGSGFHNLGTPAPNELNKLILKKVGTLTTGTLNGVALNSFTSTYALTIDLLCKYALGLPLSGIIANLSIIDAGTLIRSYPINESSGTTIFDEVSGQNGTLVNSSDDDRGLFQEAERKGNWQGSGLTVPPWASVSQIIVVA